MSVNEAIEWENGFLPVPVERLDSARYFDRTLLDGRGCNGRRDTPCRTSRRTSRSQCDASRWDSPTPKPSQSRSWQPDRRTPAALFDSPLSWGHPDLAWTIDWAFVETDDSVQPYRKRHLNTPKGLFSLSACLPNKKSISSVNEK